jgi:hypothetical protein
MRAERPQVLFVVDGFRLGEGDAFLHGLAYESGFRPFVAPWFRLVGGDSTTFIIDGFEQIGREQTRAITSYEPVRPAAIFHSFDLSPRAAEIFQRIAESHPDAIVSFEPRLAATENGGRRVMYAAATLQPLACHAFSDAVPPGDEWQIKPDAEAALASWSGMAALRSQPAFSRLAVLASIDERGRGSLLPLRGNSIRDPSGLRAVTRYLEIVNRRVIQPPVLSWASPALQFGSRSYPAVDFHDDEERGPVLRNAAAILSDYEGREVFARRANAVGPVVLQLEGDGLEECRIVLSTEGDSPCLDLIAEASANLDAIAHPMSRVLPMVRGENGTVETNPWPAAELRWSHPDFVLPTFHGLSREDTILRYLGRVTGVGKPSDNIGRRFVEPGVGRSALVDFVRVAGRPELRDFAVTGIGLTQYSAGGFASLGVEINGRAALIRANHRRRCAERLEEAGVRAAPVLAIIELPGDPIIMPDNTRSPAAIVVRGFRTVLRIKQLDPVAPFFHSVEHAATLLPFLEDSRWDPVPTASDDRELIGYAHLRYGAVAGDLRDITAAGPEIDDVFALARARRRQIISSFAPHVLDLARHRLAHELGRDPEREMPTYAEYVLWFAETFGRQFAALRRLRFLHDYHHTGTSRNSPQWVYTLVENNVSLLAELADLDTAVFLDGSEPDILDEIQLTRADIALLAENFQAFHLRDVTAARAILRTMALIATHGDEVLARSADETFNRAYQEGDDS